MDIPPAPDASDVLARKEEVDALLAGVSDRQREILRLSKVEGIPLQEIAERMKMSLAAVKVTIYRTLRSIRGNTGGKGEAHHENE